MIPFLQITGRWYTVNKYEDAYGSSLACGYGTYSPIDDYSIKVVDCELSEGKYSCLTGIISLEDSKSEPLEGRTSYAYFDKRKQVSKVTNNGLLISSNLFSNTKS